MAKNAGIFDDTKKLVIVLVLLLSLPVALSLVKSRSNIISQARPDAVTGSGAPNGPHYNLNIIGVPKQKSADMTGSEGHRIFVSLVGKTKINLTEGEDYQVLDANGTDGTAAFQLPNPDPDNDGITEYSVWARPLGKPGGKSSTTTCAVDELGQEWCSVYTLVLVREAGNSKFTDVSKQLLYIYVDLNGDGAVERYPLFDDALQGYFWNYDNQGMKLVQLRFYQVISNVN
ncbi:MAG: hypothetical protein A3F04_01315 [Candidatus Chisholmbacteria bacterium RIFCSPHIGHO2_12_FULL_49_9]|uniref:Uncharacterized protein n=1 Tax=Candidatus Chisholmbacteria bacterium RIFCSPHIGHO2_01_FULL_52_32 TaxID=1797591 RepID=A0A1G1VTJ7_9BACT|nr:MAG: hypothetical protein A2786_04495 [Candidatus Chisholmbacteria bacterium RIFCSPHIGHO2_01_FULL_52_32]OGY19905.1 MAG: hypothetical protein A2900_02250 [Candidatus Chisholmbacteria bacterium RIFCSPLOWO2_01_FULL_50_28]OGY21259.1 MAG: hypothetical protein A3F04_01315 [Candidatus Chisholmbacteria bacterium RIFCSPHIGHO2_12_FULL_49_9]